MKYHTPEERIITHDGEKEPYSQLKKCDRCSIKDFRGYRFYATLQEVKLHDETTYNGITEAEGFPNEDPYLIVEYFFGDTAFGIRYGDDKEELIRADGFSEVTGFNGLRYDEVITFPDSTLKWFEQMMKERKKEIV